MCVYEAMKHIHMTYMVGPVVNSAPARMSG